MERDKVVSARELGVSLAALAAGASTAAGAPAAPAKIGFQAVSIKHVSVRVLTFTVPRSSIRVLGMPLRQQSATVIILGVGDFLLGIEQAQGNTAAIDHSISESPTSMSITCARAEGATPEIRFYFTGIVQVL